MPVRDFAIELMRFYDPINHALIFGDEPSVPASKPEDTRSLEERILKLESLLQTK